MYLGLQHLDELHKYEKIWQEIRIATNANHALSDVVERQLLSLHTQVAKKLDLVDQLTQFFVYFPSMSEELSDMIAETAKVSSLCEDVEARLAYLEVLCHTQACENLASNGRSNLESYRYKKEDEFNRVKTDLAYEYMKASKVKERRISGDRSEKQRCLQEMVTRDIELYRMSGVLPSKFCFASTRLFFLPQSQCPRLDDCHDVYNVIPYPSVSVMEHNNIFQH
ncbi:unnamed protein product [Soboliphyme baturini]|uniref:BAR domain-containing protein n=1 Tax=Soboliphyme baturini TaxID=241478 RepID=A0A183J795_9BILA|nr:unnamed protein product [Soboliphyme baturini]